MPGKASDADFENAIRSYLAGESVEETARRFHVSDKRLSDALKARGVLRDVETRSRIASRKAWDTRGTRIQLPTEALVRRYLAGESEKILASEFGTSRSVIRRHLLAAGITPRNRSEGMTVRMAQTPAEERLRLSAAAHDAVRGTHHTWDQLCKRALGKQRNQSHVSPAELLMAEWLAQRGIESFPQQAIGPYNADLAVESVAVEIFGGGWHAYGDHKRITPERYRYILDQGWAVVIVWVDRRKYPLRVQAAEYIAALVKRTRRDPSLRGQYWVIRGDGKECAAGETDLDKIAVIPSGC